MNTALQCVWSTTAASVPSVPLCSRCPLLHLFASDWRKADQCACELRMLFLQAWHCLYCKHLFGKEHCWLQICLFFSFSPISLQVPALLLFCCANTYQYWRTSWATHSLWDHVSDVKLFRWCLCILKLNWTGKMLPRTVRLPSWQSVQLEIY